MTHENASFSVPLRGGRRIAAPDLREGAIPTAAPAAIGSATRADVAVRDGMAPRAIHERHMNAIALLQCGPRKCSIRGAFRAPMPARARIPSTPTITAAGDRT